MWSCPSCHREFANSNQRHACGRYSLETHFAEKPTEIRALFDAFVERLSELGPVLILPQKTRIAFQARMSFAQLTPKKHWIDGHLVLPLHSEANVFRRITEISPRNHVHEFRLHPAEGLPAELIGFLPLSYFVGEQRHLSRG
jgi:Domain of unknown function (DUF5655)